MAHAIARLRPSLPLTHSKILRSVSSAQLVGWSSSSQKYLRTSRCLFKLYSSNEGPLRRWSSSSSFSSPSMGVGVLGNSRQWCTTPSQFLQQRYMSSQHDKQDPPTRANAPLPPFPSSPSVPLHENIYTIPNFLTLTRLLSAPLLAHLLLSSHYTPALYLLLYASATDLLDGYLARRFGSHTVLGTILDPLADKALAGALVGCLTYQAALPLPLAGVIVGRDVGLAGMALWYRWVSLGEMGDGGGRTLKRFWDFSLPSAEVKPSAISKVNTFLQLAVLGGTVVGLAMGEADDMKEGKAIQEGEGKKKEKTGVDKLGFNDTGKMVMQASWYVVAATTIISGLGYVRGRKGLKMLKQGQSPR